MERDSISCDICLNFERIYPSQSITGSVAITAPPKYTVQQILIEISGTAECEWEFDKHFVKYLKIYKKGTTFSGSQEFFISRHTLAGGTSSSVILSQTPQVFPFRCGLPEYLPATWTGQHGTIKYIAKAKIKEENNTVLMFSKEVRVHARRNLRLEQHLLNEARLDVHRQFRYAVLSLGIVKLSVWLPLCGIAAGQAIPLVCTIQNGSKIQFGGLIFVLTQIEIYRSNKPTVTTKTYRKDICRVPRMVDVLHSSYDYYCMLETDPDLVPTNQFSRCKCCQVTYEVWVSLQGAIPRYNAYGYPNIDTPGIPVVIGTEPLSKWDGRQITNDVMAAVYADRPPVEMESLPPDDEVEEMLNFAEEEMDPDTEHNLAQQLVDKTLYTPDEDNTTGSSASDVPVEVIAGNEDEGDEEKESISLSSMFFSA